MEGYRRYVGYDVLADDLHVVGWELPRRARGAAMRTATEASVPAVRQSGLRGALSAPPALLGGARPCAVSSAEKANRRPRERSDRSRHFARKHAFPARHHIGVFLTN